MTSVVAHIVCIIFSFFFGIFVNKVLNNLLIFLKDDESVFNRAFILKFIIPCYLFSYSILAFSLGYQDIFSKVIQVICIVLLLSYIFIRFVRTNKKEKRLLGFKREIEDVILAWIDAISSNRKNINFKMNIYYEGQRIRGDVTIDVPEDVTLSNEKIKYLEQELWSKKIMVYIQKKNFEILDWLN
ncbi:hypothetical protein PDJ96_13350 [Bacillus cereus group sp. BY17LC]|uniref:hypothetical protein n=1 Tax=Bacillus cereus group TaxID=86661 RepID=UPI0022DFADAE|nr:hypothetical protein [Bacillus cereus group sp. BY17LC]MDA1837702.1 hypothetical protein [Bacillus cereus group sp. BY17LC]